MKGNLEKVEKVAKDICEKHHVGLYDMELKNTKKGKVLSVEITKIGGVSIDDCENVSRNLSAFLDENDLIPGKYYLEVSSPGIERNLTQKKHYVSAINEKVKVTYKTEEATKTVVGILKEVFPEHITVLVEEELEEIKFKDIKKAKTVFELKK